MPVNSKQMVVYSVLEKKGGTVWVKLGTAYVNRDESMNIYLDALPIGGKLHLREKPAGKTERTREEQNDPGVALSPLGEPTAEAMQ